MTELDTAVQAAVIEDCPPRARTFHHVGVQVGDLEASIAWYTKFFGAEISWTLKDFSPLSLTRLPGMTQLVELVSGPLRFHLFERDGVDGALPAVTAVQFQHLCIDVESPLDLIRWRRRWFTATPGAGTNLAAELLPTEIVVDDVGVESFYCLDPDGLEFEFTYIPENG